MALSWQNSKCYQKCLCKEDGSSESLCHNNDQNAKFRYCPQDGNGCACQVQCYTANLHGKNREIELFGKDKLADWDVRFEDILVNSYDNYRKTHNGNLLTSHSLVAAMEHGERRLALPTCASSQIIMGDFQADTRSPKRINRHFPCTCGNWRSDETETFMNNLGLGKGQSDYQLGLAKLLFKKDCPRVSYCPIL